MGLCKCRQCGTVVPTTRWAASSTAGACPSCGHGQFSISFPPAVAVGPVAPDVIPPIDAHGRKRKVIRLEDLSGGAPQSTHRPSFKERMRDYSRMRPDPYPGDDDA